MPCTRNRYAFRREPRPQGEMRADDGFPLQCGLYLRPFARATCHDGIFPNRGRDPLTPHDVRRLVERLREAGLPPERPFGSAVSGNASQPGAIPSRSTSPPSPRRGQRGGWSR